MVSSADSSIDSGSPAEEQDSGHQEVEAVISPQAVVDVGGDIVPVAARPQQAVPQQDDLTELQKTGHTVGQQKTSHTVDQQKTGHTVDQLKIGHVGDQGQKLILKTGHRQDNGVE